MNISRKRRKTPGKKPPKRKEVGPSKGKTLVARKLTREDVEWVDKTLAGFENLRPTNRGDCREELRPCPFVSCEFHLYLDVHPVKKSLKRNFPDLEVWEMPETCALDVAERGGSTLEEVGLLLNLTRERVRQIEAIALGKLRGSMEKHLGED